MRWDVFVGAFINSFVILYVSSKLLKCKQEKNYNFIFKSMVSLVVLSLYIFFGYVITQTVIRTILLFLMIILANYYIYHSYQFSLVKIVLVSFISWITAFLSEMIFMIIICGVLQINIDQVQQEILGNFIVNFLISFIFFLIGTNSFYIKFCSNIINKFENFKEKYLIIITLLTVIAFSIMVYLSYFKFNMTMTFLLNLIVILIYIYVIYKLFDEKEKATQMQNEYEELEKSLNEYEKMYQTQRMLTHEHKNELSVILGLAHKNNKKLIQYLNKIADFSNDGNENWLSKLNYISDTGLRGLFYYKIQTMNQKNINVDLQISRNFTNSAFRNLTADLKPKIYKLLGIYLDNAIQAVSNLENRNILIDLYCKKKNGKKYILIAIMNNYNGKFDLERINEKGYSTNGKGRGFGLAIAQEIIDTEKKISHSLNNLFYLFSLNQISV